jgi:cell division protein FtsQ
VSFTRTLGRRARFMPRASPRDAARRRRLRTSPRLRLALLAALLVAGLGFGGWMWLRDSSLVAVSQVTITGDSGANAGAIRSALRSAARNMTTLDVQMGQLRTAVAPFPEVGHLRVRTVFPHRMVIGVIEQRPVGLLEVGGRAVPVAADGTILRAVAVSATLPAIPLSVVPVGRHVRERRAADAVALLAAAPNGLLARISQVTNVAGHGLVAQLRNGPSIYFGDTLRLSAKWLAATAVLGDQGSAGAAYIDVTDPARPAAGAGAAPTAATSSTSAAGATSGAASSAGPAPSSSSSGG